MAIAVTICSVCREPLNAKGQCVACLLRTGLDKSVVETKSPASLVFALSLRAMASSPVPASSYQPEQDGRTESPPVPGSRGGANQGGGDQGDDCNSNSDKTHGTVQLQLQAQRGTSQNQTK